MKEVERLNVDTDSLNVEIENETVKVSIKKEENHTLGDLRQKIINYLYNLKEYDESDIEIMKILFD